VNAKTSKEKVDETNKSIAALQQRLQELNAHSRLLDEDLMDLNTLENQMLEVCESE